MNLQKILFIDDRVAEFRDIIADFKGSGIEVVELDGLQQLEEYLQKGEPFDAVILDWYFDDESTIARLCLKKIKEVRFVPVLVWTEEPELFDNDLPLLSFFPRSCIERVSKGDVNKDVMVGYVSEWFQKSTVTSLSTQWRSSCAQATEQSLYQLAQLDEKDVIQALRIFIQTEESNANLDLDQAIEVLARLLQRELMNDTQLAAYLTDKLRAAQTQEGKASSKAPPSKVLRLHMYYGPKDDFVRTGDIIRMHRGDKELVAVVATPACDLARPRTEYLRLILTGECWQGSGSLPADRCMLQFLVEEGKEYQNREARFQEVISIKNQDLARITNVKERASVMRYSHKYESMGGQEVTISRITRLDDPYRADLLQRFAAHASRVGVPEFK